MRYGCSDDLNKRAGQSPVQSTVTSARKITSFVRSRRKKISLEEDINEADYDNNGHRQSSIVDFMSP